MEGQDKSFQKETREVEMTALVFFDKCSVFHQTLMSNPQTSPSRKPLIINPHEEPSKSQPLKNFDYPKYDAEE